MTLLMRIGTALTVVVVLAFIVVVGRGLLDPETREIIKEARPERVEVSRDVESLWRQSNYYFETSQIFLIDDVLDEGECHTLTGIYEPLIEAFEAYEGEGDEAIDLERRESRLRHIQEQCLQ